MMLSIFHTKNLYRWKGVVNICKLLKKGLIRTSIYDRIRSRYAADFSKCVGTEKLAGEAQPYPAETKASKITEMMQEILQRDQKIRATAKAGQDWAAQQRPLDIKNQMLIDSLFNKHNTYIGKSVVGEKNQSVMWIVIQHSDINRMERYLPYIKESVRSNELPVANLKMLIDRIYAVRYKVQIFGTQSNVTMADKKMIYAVMEEYGIR